jgi:MFS family permease
MEPIRITYNEWIAYAAASGVIIGVLLGLIPLILGVKKRNRKYGMYGFVGSVIGGAFAPIIPIIVVSIFSWLILRKSKADLPPPNSSETNSDVTSDSENA